jgi:anti-repressor protein
MENLITINKTAKGTDVVSARELYEGLGFDTSHWAKWYEKNIIKNQFVKENEDWVVLAPSAKTSEGGRPTKDFVITLDFAKRLAMQAKTEKGEAIRSYFIECEKKAILAATPALPSNYKEALQLLLEKEEDAERKQRQIDQQKKELAFQAPKLAYLEEVLDSKSLIATSVIASELGMSAMALNQLLQTMGILRKVNGILILTAEYATKDIAAFKTYPYVDSNGKNCTKNQLYWKETGRQLIHDKVEKKRTNLLKAS